MVGEATENRGVDPEKIDQQQKEILEKKTEVEVLPSEEEHEQNDRTEEPTGVLKMKRDAGEKSRLKESEEALDRVAELLTEVELSDEERERIEGIMRVLTEGYLRKGVITPADVAAGVESEILGREDTQVEEIREESTQTLKPEFEGLYPREDESEQVDLVKLNETRQEISSGLNKAMEKYQDGDIGVLGEPVNDFMSNLRKIEGLRVKGLISNERRDAARSLEKFIKDLDQDAREMSSWMESAYDMLSREQDRLDALESKFKDMPEGREKHKLEEEWENRSEEWDKNREQINRQVDEKYLERLNIAAENGYLTEEEIQNWGLGDDEGKRDGGENTSVERV